MSEAIELSPEYYRGYHLGFCKGISNAYEQFGPLIAAAQNPAPIILQGVALLDIKEALQNSSASPVQQLKAKIAALVQEHFFVSDCGVSYGHIGEFVTKLRQLTAV